MRCLGCKACANADNEYCFACDNGNQFKPVTNADRIRAMTDEELAEFMNNGCDVIAPSANCASAFYDCKRCWLDWLKLEAK